MPHPGTPLELKIAKHAQEIPCGFAEVADPLIRPIMPGVHQPTIDLLEGDGRLCPPRGLARRRIGAAQYMQPQITAQLNYEIFDMRLLRVSGLPPTNPTNTVRRPV